MDASSAIDSTATEVTAPPDPSPSYLPPTDSKYKTYVAQIDKALKNFEYSLEWHDLISALSKLNKVISTWTAKYGDLPRLNLVTKRLSQCLHPTLPSGVHGKTLETYSLIFNALPQDRIKSNFFAFAAGLYPLYTYAGLQTRPTLINIFSSPKILPTVSTLPYLEGLLISIFSTQDESSEIDEKSLLSRIDQNLLEITTWRIIRDVPATTRAGVNYLLQNNLNSIEKEEAISTLIGILSSDDIHPDSSLTHRSVLELLLKFHPVESLSSTLQPTIISASLLTLLKKDMSLNRRLFSWLGTEQSTSIHPHLTTALRWILSSQPKSDSTRILITLLDKPEYDLIDSIIFDVFQCLLADQSQETRLISNMFFSNLKTDYVFDKLTELCLEKGDFNLMTNFILFDLECIDYPEHLPSVLIAILDKFQPEFQEVVSVILDKVDDTLDEKTFKGFIDIFSRYLEGYQIAVWEEITKKEPDFWSNLKLNNNERFIVKFPQIPFDSRYCKLLEVFSRTVIPSYLSPTVIQTLLRIAVHGDPQTILVAIRLSSHILDEISSTYFIESSTENLWDLGSYNILAELIALAPAKVQKLIMNRLTCTESFQKLIKFLQTLDSFENGELLLYKLFENLESSDPTLRAISEVFFTKNIMLVSEIVSQNIHRKGVSFECNFYTPPAPPEEKKSTSLSDLREVSNITTSSSSITKHKSTSELFFPDFQPMAPLSLPSAQNFYRILASEESTGTEKILYVLTKLEKLLSLKATRTWIINNTTLLDDLIRALISNMMVLEDNNEQRCLTAPLSVDFEPKLHTNTNIHFKSIDILQLIFRAVLAQNDDVDLREHLLKTSCIERNLLQILYFLSSGDSNILQENLRHSCSGNDLTSFYINRVLSLIGDLLPLEDPRLIAWGNHNQRQSNSILSDSLFTLSMRLGLSSSSTTSPPLSGSVHSSWMTLILEMPAPFPPSPLLNLATELVCENITADVSPDHTSRMLEFLYKISDKWIVLQEEVKPVESKPTQSLYGIFLSSLLPTQQQQEPSEDDIDNNSTASGPNVNLEKILPTLVTISGKNTSVHRKEIEKLIDLIVSRNLPSFLRACSKLSNAGDLAKLTRVKADRLVQCLLNSSNVNSNILRFILECLKLESNAGETNLLPIASLTSLLSKSVDLSDVTTLKILELCLSTSQLQSTNSPRVGKELQEIVIKTMERLVSRFVAVDDNKECPSDFMEFSLLFAPVVDLVWSEDTKERDKVVSYQLTNIFSLVSPFLSNESTSDIRRVSYYTPTLVLLREMSSYSYMRKIWKKDVFDLLLSDKFTILQDDSITSWKTVGDNLFTQDKTSFSEMLTRVSVPQTTTLFNSSSSGVSGKETESQQRRAMLLNRLAFALYCSEQDQYAKFITNIQERLAEALKTVPVPPEIHRSVFLCFRVITIKFSSNNLAALWPIIVHELVQVLTALEKSASGDPEASSSPQPLSLTLESFKLLEQLMTLPPQNLPIFQMYRWAFKAILSSVGGTLAPCENKSNTQDSFPSQVKTLDSLADIGWFLNLDKHVSNMELVLNGIDRDFQFR